MGREGRRCPRQEVKEDQGGLGRVGEGPELPRAALQLCDDSQKSGWQVTGKIGQ